MNKKFKLTGSKEEMLDQFTQLIKNNSLNLINREKEYTGDKYKRCDTVDGNPSAATKQCHPYTGTARGGRIGINGQIGGRGRGTYGD